MTDLSHHKNYDSLVSATREIFTIGSFYPSSVVSFPHRRRYLKTEEISLNQYFRSWSPHSASRENPASKYPSADISGVHLLFETVSDTVAQQCSTSPNGTSSTPTNDLYRMITI